MTIRILHLIDSGGLYGAERVLLALASLMNGPSNEIIVGSIGLEADEEKEIEAECRRRGINLVCFRMPSGFSLASIRVLTHYLKETKIDIVHSHGYKPTILLGFLTRKQRGGAHMISTVHGFTGGSVKMWLYQLADSFARAFIDAVVFVSPTMPRSRSINLIPNSNSRVIPNGIPLEASENKLPQDRRQEIIRFKGDDQLIVAVGRLSLEKNLSMLLSAFKLISERSVGSKLLVVGDGPLKAVLQNQIEELGLDESVLMIGFQDSVPEILQISDVFVLTSNTEGSPLSVLEAMRAEVPIVCTRVGALPMMLVDGHDAYLVEKGDREGFATRVLDLIHNIATRQKFASRLKNKFLENYTDDLMVSRYQSLYESLLIQNGLADNKRPIK